MKIVFTPDWFLAPDVLISVFIFLTLTLFCVFSIKSWKINRKRSSLFLAIGFSLIALAELAEILTKTILFYDFPVVQQIGQFVITTEIVHTVDIFYHIGFFFNKFLSLLGLYIIYKLPALRKPSADFLITIYFLILVAVLGEFYNNLYYVTALILLVLIIKNYFDIYKKGHNKNTKILFYAFSILAFSELVFILSKLNAMYVAGKGLQLVSYIILLCLIIKIQNGTKEKPNRNHSRHA